MGIMDRGFGYDPEAVIQDADIEQAQWEEEARHTARQQARGICQHLSAQGNKKDNTIVCTEGCGAVFADDDAWHAAMQQAKYQQ